MEREAPVKVQVIRSRYVPGRVVIGPKAIGDGYYRIVSQQDHSGRIEAFDPRSRSWSAAPEAISFSEIWRAPSAPQWCMDLAGAPPCDFEEDDTESPDGDSAAEGAELRPDGASVNG
jgi:hypothetical protein